MSSPDRLSTLAGPAGPAWLIRALPTLAAHDEVRLPPGMQRGRPPACGATSAEVESFVRGDPGVLPQRQRLPQSVPPHAPRRSRSVRQTTGQGNDEARLRPTGPAIPRAAYPQGSRVLRSAATVCYARWERPEPTRLLDLIPHRQCRNPTLALRAARHISHTAVGKYWLV